MDDINNNKLIIQKNVLKSYYTNFQLNCHFIYNIYKNYDDWIILYFYIL